MPKPTPIFARSDVFSRYRRSWSDSSKTLVRNLVIDDPDITNEKITKVITSELLLDPLVIHDPTHITIRLDADVGVGRHQHELAVPFRGSGLLWRVRLPGLDRPLHLEARIGVSTAHLAMRFYGMPVQSFLQDIEPKLARVRELVPGLEPLVETCNMRVAPWVETFMTKNEPGIETLRDAARAGRCSCDAIACPLHLNRPVFDIVDRMED